MPIVSIVFDKIKSEYTITHRDEKTGKFYSIKANHLTQEEKQIASSFKHYNQTPYFISWC